MDCDSAVLKKVKKISMTCNILPLRFAPSQARSSQNSNVEDTLEGYKIIYALPYNIFLTLQKYSFNQMSSIPKCQQIFSTSCE